MGRLTAISLALSLLASQASAACYADYKARQDEPYRLHYGVAEIRGECTVAAATQELRARLASTTWHLLSVESVFDEDGLDERRQDAGQFFLRF